MKILITIIIYLGVFTTVNSQDSLLKYNWSLDKLTGNYIRGDSLPSSCKNVKEIIYFLDIIFHPVTKDYIKSISEVDFINSYYWSVDVRENIYFRNVYDSLLKFGRRHQLTEMILKVYYRFNKGINVNIDETIKQYILDSKNYDKISNEQPVISDKRHELINNKLISKATAIRSFNQINDTTYKITLTIFPVNSGLASLYEQIPCHCSNQMYKYGKNASYLNLNRAFRFMWILLENKPFDIIYYVNCKLKQQDYNLFYGDFDYLNSDYDKPSNGNLSKIKIKIYNE